MKSGVAVIGTELCGRVNSTRAVWPVDPKDWINSDSNSPMQVVFGRPHPPKGRKYELGSSVNTVTESGSLKEIIKIYETIMKLIR